MALLICMNTDFFYQAIDSIKIVIHLHPFTSMSRRERSNETTLRVTSDPMS